MRLFTAPRSGILPQVTAFQRELFALAQKIWRLSEFAHGATDSLTHQYTNAEISRVLETLGNVFEDLGWPGELSADDRAALELLGQVFNPLDEDAGVELLEDLKDAEDRARRESNL